MTNKKPQTVEEAIRQQHILEEEIRNSNLKPALLDKYKILGEEIALIKSDFKCENCEKTEELTYHHLISRRNKMVLPLQKYFAQRRFYQNIIILCSKCHFLVDNNGVSIDRKPSLATLKQETINKTKKQFNIN